jgi:hypothetical protein
MARTVVAVFESVYSAKQAVWELVDVGFPRERIDLFPWRVPENLIGLAKPEKVRSEVEVNELRAGVNIGAAIGGSLGITGALLINLGTLTIPPFLSSRINGFYAAVVIMLGVILFCMIAGSLAGSLITGLVGLGIPEEEIRQYAKNVHKGGVTVMIVADWDAVDGTLEILGHHNPLEIKQKSIEWRKADPRDKRLSEHTRRAKVTEHNRPR